MSGDHSSDIYTEAKINSINWFKTSAKPCTINTLASVGPDDLDRPEVISK